MRRKDIGQIILLYCLSGIFFMIGFVVDRYCLFSSYNKIISEGIAIIAFILLTLFINKIANLIRKYRRIYYLICGFTIVFFIGVGVKLIQFIIKIYPIC